MAETPRLGEFERIARFFAPLAAPGGLGLRDDAALIDGPPGQDYVLTADAIVEGVHFLSDDPPKQIAQKLLRVNLSDLAAKGAVPVGYLLTTALPAARGEDWLSEFATGLAADQATYGIGLLGGDSVATSGPISLSLTALGRVAKGGAVLRSGARAGDLVYVTGTLGDAALGLAVLRGGFPSLDAAARAFLADRYRLPQPRLTVGQRLAGIAHAMIDVSDGLAGDLGHLCAASGLAAVIEAGRLPLSAPGRAAIDAEPAQFNAILAGGDDYELLFTAPTEVGAVLAALAHDQNVPITEIGRMEKGAGVTVLDAQGAAMTVGVAGYRHF